MSEVKGSAIKLFGRTISLPHNDSSAPATLASPSSPSSPPELTSATQQHQEHQVRHHHICFSFTLWKTMSIFESNRDPFCITVQLLMGVFKSSKSFLLGIVSIQLNSGLAAIFCGYFYLFF